MKRATLVGRNPPRGLGARCARLSAARSRRRRPESAAREVPRESAAAFDRGPALGAGAPDVERHRVPLPPGLGLLLPDRDRGARHDRRAPHRSVRRQALRPLRPPARCAPRGVRGRAARAAGRRRLYGADAAFAEPELATRLASWDPVTYRFSGYLAESERLYLSDGDDAVWAARFQKTYRDVRDRDFGPGIVGDAGEILHEMRLVKDDEDLRFLRRAAEISAHGHVLAMGAAAPGKVRVRGPGGARRVLPRQRRPAHGVSVDRRLRTEQRHAPLVEERPADPGRRGRPERLGRRVRALRDRHHAHVSGRAARFSPEQRAIYESCSTRRRRRWPSSARGAA